MVLSDDSMDQMERLSNYILSGLILRCTKVVTLSHTLREKTHQLQTHIRVKRVGEWLDRYSNLQHLTINSYYPRTRLVEQLLAITESLSRENCEKLRTIRTAGYDDNQYYIYNTQPILPIMKACKNLELLQANMELSADDISELSALPTFSALAANPNRMRVRQRESLPQYEIVQAHLPDCIKLYFDGAIQVHSQEGVSSLLSIRCLRRVYLAIHSDVSINAEYIEDLAIDNISNMRVSITAPNLTHLLLGSHVVGTVSAPRLSVLTVCGLARHERLSLINSLPSLTSLRLTYCKTEILSQLKCPSLTCLTISPEPPCHVDVSKLPSTLKSLTVETECSCTGFSKTTLVSVSVQSHVYEPLPATLTCLDAMEVDPIHLIDCKYLKSLHCDVLPECTTPWPDSIRVLSLVNTSSKWPSIPLPRALRSLIVTDDECSVERNLLPDHWDLSHLSDLELYACVPTEKQKNEFRGEYTGEYRYAT